MSTAPAENDTAPIAAEAIEAGVSNVIEGTTPRAMSQGNWSAMSNDEVAAEIAQRVRARLRYRAGRFEVLVGDEWVYDLTQGGDVNPELCSMSRDAAKASASGTQQQRSKAARVVLRLESCATMVSVIGKLRRLLAVPK